MAKVPFSKLKCKINDSVKEVQLTDDIVIEVKQYLPIQDKLGLISTVIMQAHEQDESYSNPVKAKVFEELEVIFAYTNLSFSDKQKEDLPKLYDMLLSSGIIEKVREAIPTEERESISKGIKDSIHAVYEYQNSAFGILDSIAHDYDFADSQFMELVEQVKSGTGIELVKDILTKIG